MFYLFISTTQIEKKIYVDINMNNEQNVRKGNNLGEEIFNKYERK